ncbi:hypothetical protein JMJ76_0014387 [Colletotrichum scovillei]|nr:hypothetical protein JMJ76_0014387 [Colletotrichum scovillei]
MYQSSETEVGCLHSYPQVGSPFGEQPVRRNVSMFVDAQRDFQVVGHASGLRGSCMAVRICK